MFEDNNLLEKYNAIWHKVSGDIKKEFDSTPVSTNFFWKLNQNLMVKKLQILMIKKSQIASIKIDSAFKKDGNCYLQVLWKQCKYIEKKVIRHIFDDLESSWGSNFEEEILKMSFLSKQLW